MQTTLVLGGQAAAGLVRRQPASRQRTDGMALRMVQQQRSVRVASYRDDLSDEELERQLEEFMARQAEVESGAAVRKVEPGQVLGADEVSEEDARRMCQEVVGVLKDLKALRDMTISEVRLTISVEDPRARELRLMGMEDKSGVSRDEMATALMDVTEGRVPADRIALRELHREMVNWPFLRQDTESDPPAQRISAISEEDGGSSSSMPEPAPRPPIGRDKSEEPQGLADMLPDWVGYGALYAVSILPVLIVIGVTAILFLNSLH